MRGADHVHVHVHVHDHVPGISPVNAEYTVTIRHVRQHYPNLGIVIFGCRKKHHTPRSAK